MMIRVLLTVLLVSCLGQLIGQTSDSTQVDINHIFFCVDAATYENLLKNEFIAKVFADTRELSNKTLTDSWTGKYLTGRDSYIEVFAPKSDSVPNHTLGDKFGDLGIVFKTKIVGE